MLPEELNADVHQLRSIQGGAAGPGVPGGVGGTALELVGYLNAGGVGAYGDLVGVPGVPGQGRVQIPEQPVPGHEGFARAAFLAGAAIEDHGGEVLEVTLDIAYKYMENAMTVTQKGMETISTPASDLVASVVMNRQSAISLRNLLIQSHDNHPRDFSYMFPYMDFHPHTPDAY